MNTNGKASKNEPNVVTSFSGLAHDVVELAELQARLLSLDVKSTGRNAVVAFILTVVGVSFLLGSIFVALFAVAELLVEKMEWTHSTADIVAAFIGLVVGGAVLAGAWHRWRSGLDSLHRSRAELSRNVAWIKSSLRKQSAHPVGAEHDAERPPMNPR